MPSLTARQVVGTVTPTTTARALAPYVLLSSGTFVTLAIIGAAIGVENASASTVPAGPNLEGPAWTAPEFFAHNSTVLLLLVAGGAVLGLPTVFLLGYNAVMVGSITGTMAADVGPVLTVVLLLPHGIFELPALWIGAAVGLRWFHAVWLTAKGKGTTYALPYHIWHSVVALAVALSLLAVAAWVEAALTVPFARFVAAY